jgi:hypothetical protein
MPIPRRIAVPTGPALERRIVALLRVAGGSLARNALREAINPRLLAAELDRATEALTGRGLVRVERTTSEWVSIHGHESRVPVTKYILTERGGRET